MLFLIVAIAGGHFFLFYKYSSGEFQSRAFSKMHREFVWVFLLFSIFFTLLLNNNKYYKLQLGSLRDLDKAKEAYKNITIKYKDFFKNESPVIEKIDFPDNGVFYRIKSYESFSKKEASDICEILILDNKKCLVIKNDKE